MGAPASSGLILLEAYVLSRDMNRGRLATLSCDGRKFRFPAYLDPKFLILKL